MSTNIPNVYAAGDIAEIVLNGKTKINPIHVNATKGGEIAGANMVGDEKVLEEHVDDMNVVTLFDLPILTLGAQKGERIVQDKNPKCLVKIYVKKLVKLMVFN